MKTTKTDKGACKPDNHNFYKVSEGKVLCSKCGEVRKYEK